MNRTFKALLVVTALAVCARAQNDTAYVPVLVTNTNAQVKIVPDAACSGCRGDSSNIIQNQQAILKLILPTNTSVTHGAQRMANISAAASHGRGNVMLSLHPQTFEKAQVSLFSVSGKRVLRGKTSAANANGTNISRRNVAPGVYLLSVKGTDGNSYTYKFNHTGGRLEIKTVYGIAADRLNKQAKALADGWTLTASATGYITKTQDVTPAPVKGTNNPVQTVTLVAAGGTSGKSALQYFKDEGIKLGWNLGNTLDAVNWSTGTASETAWNPNTVTKAFIDGVAARGVDIVRIGCSWNGHVGGAPNYTISETRMARVQQVVDWVIDAGMKAVINIHHDGNAQNVNNQNTAGDTRGFLKFAEVRRGGTNNETLNTQVKDQLGKMWTQIANRFKNYGDELIFETMNEVHSGNWGCQDNTARCTGDQDLLHSWNQTALNAIRATGGNNATRYVAIPGLGSTEPETVIAAANRNPQKLLPDDGSNGTDRLIVSVHFYAPWQYTVADVTGQGGDGRHTITSAELNHIATAAQDIKRKFIDNGIAVYYGEWGAQTNVRNTMTDKIKDDHVDYIKRVAVAATANGILPIIWDDGGNFKILSRSNGNVESGLATRVWNAYVEAVGGTAVITDPGTGDDPVPPTNIQGNLGNYVFGTQENGIDDNYSQARWTLTGTNLNLAKTSGTKLVLTLTNAPTGAAQLVWQGPTMDPPVWWQDNSDILGESGSPVSGKGVTWNAGARTLTIDLSQALVDYNTFRNQSALNLILAYYGHGMEINALGITRAELTQ